MAVTINASTSSGLVQTADTSGTVEIQSNGTTKFTVATTGAYGQLVSDTAKTATSTSVDFTGIPSWVKRITIMLQGVSTSGTSDIIVRIGAGTTPETSGYLGSATQVSTSAGIVASNATDNGFCIAPSVSNATTFHGLVVITLITGSSWVSASTLSRSDASASQVGGGSKTITGTLGVVRITTVNGTDTFDAGTINILYEG